MTTPATVLVSSLRARASRFHNAPLTHSAGLNTVGDVNKIIDLLESTADMIEFQEQELGRLHEQVSKLLVENVEYAKRLGLVKEQ
jgi:hypothetical protein